MRNAYLIIVGILLLFVSCDKESCQDTEETSIYVKFRYNVTVKHANGTPAVNMPVECSAQRHWCDGGSSITASSTKFTTESGVLNYESGSVWSLDNSLDYILITIQTGLGDDKLTQGQSVYYFDINKVDGYHNVYADFTLGF